MPSVFLSISYASLRRPHGSCPTQVPPPPSTSSRMRVDDLVLALLGQLGIEHEQDLVLGQVSDRSLLRSGRPRLAGAAGCDGAMAEQEAGPV